jgi:hypothetical protein
MAGPTFDFFGKTGAFAKDDCQIGNRPMTKTPPDDSPPAMIGLPPSARGLTDKPPADAAEHAQDFARRWRDKLEEYCAIRMQELGIPDDMNGQPDYGGGGRWHAFDSHGRKGGANTTGVVVDSGVLNPDMLKGKKGGRIWPKARLRDRIDAIIAHEYEELRHQGSHGAALKAAAKTKLPISDEARRLCRAMAR